MTRTLVRDERFQMTKDTQRARLFFEDRLSFLMTPHTLNERLTNENFRIWDVRNNEDFNKGHIPNAENIPSEKLETFMTRFSKNQINVLYCYNMWCHAATRAAKILAENNYPVMVLEGGFEGWERNNFRIER